MLEALQSVDGRWSPGAIGLAIEIAFAGESLLNFLVSFRGRLLGGAVGDDHWAFRFRSGGAFRRGGCRGLRASSRYRLLFLLRRGGSGSLGRASPRTDGEGRGQGDGKRDQDEPQEFSLAFGAV